MVLSIGLLVVVTWVLVAEFLFAKRYDPKSIVDPIMVSIPAGIRADIINSLAKCLNKSSRPILKRIVDRNPDYLMSQVNLTATYSMADKLIQAKLHAKEVLRLSPDFSAGLFMMGFPYKDKGIIDGFIDNLRKAGLPA